MTVQNQTITAGPYTGNDVADTFNYTWRIVSASQVIVIETDDLGVETVLVEGTDYRVEGIGAQGGGEIVRVVSAADTPLPTGYFWFIRSNFVPTQETDFESQGAFFPGNHEDAIDKLTRLIQQLTYSDSVTLMFSENSYLDTFNPQLPSPNVALGYLRLKSDLTGMEWATNQGGVDLSQDFNFLGDLQQNGDDVVTVTNIGSTALTPVNSAAAAIDILPAHQSAGLVTTSATAVTVTVQPNVTQDLPVGAVVPVYQAGTGQVTFAEGAGVTIEYKATEGLKISEQYAPCTLWQRALDVWVLTGSLSA